MNLRGASLLATLCLASATHGADPTAPAESLIRKFRKDAGVAFKECPDEACLTQALGPCTPAHLTKKISTIEGTPAVFDYFVVKPPEGCWLVTFRDYTKDYWGGCKVRKQVCPSLQAAKSDDPEGQGCSPSEVLFTARVCKQPYRRH